VRVGAGPEPLAVFVSASGHYATGKAAALLGLGTNAVVAVEVDADGAMAPGALRSAVLAALDAGRTPLAVIATAGTTVTCAFDPLDEVADVCAEHGTWMHVDGCYGGSALFSADHRHRLAGVERSDSFVWNLHKMMGITQQCTALLVREPERLAACFAAGADYIFQPDKQFGEWDSGDRTFQCGRRVDALKLWLAWKVHGDAGFGARIDHAVAMADFARLLIGASEDGFATIADTGFTNVVFAWVPPELRPLDLESLSEADRSRLHRLAPRVKARMQSEGTALLGYQPVHGLNTFRLLVMNPTVGTRDVEAVLDLLARYGAEEWPGTA
jgi:glutamate/tyrosine decarboxylase-like PLP-dependent enzyme